jgi:glutamate-1-semialdehyde 2,1-aminomutase
MGNSAGIKPLPGFLEKIRALCDRYGVVLVFDEVKTGFRIARGGAQEYFGLRADLVTYAKAMANGFPIAAIAGREGVMMTIEPGRVAHAGTYTGNLVGAAAADATLEILEEQPVLETIEARGLTLMAGIDQILTEAGIPHALTGLPAMFGFRLGSDETPHDFRDYLAGDAALYHQIVKGMIRRGVMPDPDGREPWFLCYSLREDDVGETLNVFQDAVREVKNVL